MPAAFITRQDLADYLGRDVTADAGATLAVDFACDLVRAETGQEINLGTSTVTLDGTGTNALLLPELPVVSAGTVTIGSTAVTDYAVDTEKGILVRKLEDDSWDWAAGDPPIPPVVWPLDAQNVTVTYVHGYADADIPQAIQGIALQAASRFLVQGPTKQESVGETSVTYSAAATDLTPSERSILRKFRR